MDKNYMYPMKLRPVLKNIVWGGYRLHSEYGKGDDTNKKIAESWELAVHKNGVNIIENGDFAGYSLEDVFKISDGEVVSLNYRNTSETPDKFPVLIKFIDAEQDLSVQVHPDDNYAEKFENESGKTEMWYIIDAEPDSKIIYGLNDSFTRDELESAFSDNQNKKFADLFNFISVKAGDVFFVPAGLIHAIGKGILIAEIQQNSDTTYRVYDYDRLVDGKKRELHTDKALDVCIKDKISLCVNKNFHTIAEERNGYVVEVLTKCKYFTVEKYIVFSKADLTADKTSFNSIICLDGSANIVFRGVEYDIKKGDSYYLPADLGEYRVSGCCVFLLVYIN